MDPQVSQRKFQNQVAQFDTDAVAAFAEMRGWRLKCAQYPALVVLMRHHGSEREIEFRFLCDDWDDLPPSLGLHDPVTGRELAYAEWPQGAWSIGDHHPVTGKPFLCLPGIREYHTHPSHRNDAWSGYRLRGTFGLHEIVDRISQRYQDTNG